MANPGQGLERRTVLITGGTGSFGQAFTRYLLSHDVAKVIIYSRDEYKQHQMAATVDDPRMRFFLGDVRDVDRLTLACRDVDLLIHAAALKHVPALEYNPTEAIDTNVLGTRNVIRAAINCNVARVVALSTDKACNPVNLYGATKLCLEKLVTAANALSGKGGPQFTVTRYGNVAGSRGSVVPVFRERLDAGQPLQVTDKRMTRFWMTLDEAVALVAYAANHTVDGGVFVPKLPSFRVWDLATAMTADHPFPVGVPEIVGIRPGEKLHESLIGPDEIFNADLHGPYYHITNAPGPLRSPCNSDRNKRWLSGVELAAAVRRLS